MAGDGFGDRTFSVPMERTTGEEDNHKSHTTRLVTPKGSADSYDCIQRVVVVAVALQVRYLLECVPLSEKRVSDARWTDLQQPAAQRSLDSHHYLAIHTLNTTPHHTTPHHATPHHTAPHRTTALHCTAQHNTAQHSTAQHNTTHTHNYKHQYNTAKHNTTQHNTTQHNTTQIAPVPLS